MKVFTRTHVPSDRGMSRVVRALERFAPQRIEIVPDAREAGLVVLHAIGRVERLTRAAEALRKQGKRYAVVQYAVRSTKTPKTSSWLPLWEKAALVWSYYDLRMLCAEDQVDASFPFYHAPLGTDFEHPSSRKQYLIATSGLSYLTESVRECVLAARTVGKPVFHVGPDLGIPGLECSDGMSDAALAVKYSQCAFVSGLRRIEGFEFPVIEGLLCGARPICFDQHHYQVWFHDLAEFVEEEPREGVLVSLENLFAQGARPVTEEEKQLARERFDWSTIVSAFYSRL